MHTVGAAFSTWMFTGSFAFWALLSSFVCMNPSAEICQGIVTDFVQSRMVRTQRCAVRCWRYVASARSMHDIGDNSNRRCTRWRGISRSHV